MGGGLISRRDQTPGSVHVRWRLPVICSYHAMLGGDTYSERWCVGRMRVISIIQPNEQRRMLG